MVERVAFLLCVTVLLCLRVPTVEAHGRLIEPPSRASMWRYGFNSPPDYNDHESYCGGFSRQWVRNGGKCGICGDAWDLPQPRAHEAGGTYGQGIIVRRYKKGSSVTIRVEITANHRGHFEFRLCKHNAPKIVATQHCFDQHVLRRAKTSDSDHPTRYYLGTESKVYEIRYVLPKEVTCNQCVLQWRYLAANNWGRCQNFSSGIGCGPQEEFRACADIAIEDKNGYVDNSPSEETTDKDQDDENDLDSNNVENVYSEQEEGWLLISIIIIFSGMFLSVFIYTALLVYYYGVNKTIKPCWYSTLQSVRQSLKTNKDVRQSLKTNKGETNTPIPPPRTKKSPALNTLASQNSVA